MSIALGFCKSLKYVVNGGIMEFGKYLCKRSGKLLNCNAG